MAAVLVASIAGFGRASAAPQVGSGRDGAGLPDWRGVWLIDPNPFDGTEAPDRPWNPPYTPEFAAKVEARRAAVAAGKALNLGTAVNCLPDGMPHMMHTPYPNEFVIGPDQVVIINEFEHQVRLIYTDGRPHPADPDPTYNGHSIGHWEGDTLVVDTVALRPDTSLVTGRGQPHSDKLHLIERIRRISKTYMQDQITIEDPVALLHPWTITYKYKLHPDWELEEFVCEDNNRSLTTELGGKALTPPSAETAKP